MLVFLCVESRIETKTTSILHREQLWQWSMALRAIHHLFSLSGLWLCIVELLQWPEELIAFRMMMESIMSLWKDVKKTVKKNIVIRENHSHSHLRAC